MARLFILVLSVLYIACTNRSSEQLLIFDAFPKSETANGVNIICNHILDPQELIIVGDFLVVLNHQKDSLFYIFSLDDFGLIKTFGKKRQGPHEYILYRNN